MICISKIDNIILSSASCEQQKILLCIVVDIRAGPQRQKWSDQQITVYPTGSIHKKAREKKFDPKKVDFDEGVLIWKKMGFLHSKNEAQMSKKRKMAKNHVLRSELGS